MTRTLIIDQTLTALVEEPQATQLIAEAKRRGLSVQELTPEGDDNAPADNPSPFMLRA
jgi:hypothetical protein